MEIKNFLHKIRSLLINNISNLIFMSLFIFVCFGCDEPSAVDNVDNSEKLFVIIQSTFINDPQSQYEFIYLSLCDTNVSILKIPTSSPNQLEKIETSISKREWTLISLSFNMDSVMAMDSVYMDGTPTTKICLDIITTLRSKSITYDPNYPNIEQNIAPIDLLTLLLNNILSKYE